MKKRTFIGIAAASAGILLLIALAMLVLLDRERFEEENNLPENPFSSEYTEDTDYTAETGIPVPPESGKETEVPSSEGEKEKTGSSEPAAGLIETEAKAKAETESGTETETGIITASSEGLEESITDGPVPDHRILFVGDSRTLGCRNAFRKKGVPDDCLYVGQVGEGCSWFREEGMKQMEAAIRDNPELPVVLNFGVNDPDQISSYLQVYDEMLQRFPETDFHFLSVNPINHDMMVEYGCTDYAAQLITQENIDRINAAIRRAYPDRYLDSASFLEENGFETVDGIHYSIDTYIRIHNFVVLQLFPPKIHPQE